MHQHKLRKGNTAMYIDVPTNVCSAVPHKDSMTSFDIPKSHNFTSPFLVSNIFPGLTSILAYRPVRFTSMYDSLFMEISEPFENAKGQFSKNSFANLCSSYKTSFIHSLETSALAKL